MSRISDRLRRFVRRLLPRALLRADDASRFLGAGDASQLRELLKISDAIRHNIKHFGYQLAREMAGSHLASEPAASPIDIGLGSKPTTQEDMESDWLRYWCHRLRIEPVYHRKLWELCYVPQAVHDYLGFREGMSGVGFGCGEEPLPSLFASMGMRITVTDLAPTQARQLGWVDSGQHLGSLEKVFYSDLADRDTFTRKVVSQWVDMNHIPDEMAGKYDFCWSICALEHLGAIQKGLDFIEDSVKVLRPGGVAVHTTEYNYTNEPETIDHAPTVFFQDRHFEQVANRLKEKGYFVADLDFDVGRRPLDEYIDIPPYLFEPGWLYKQSRGAAAHLKLIADGHPCTCFGMIIKKHE